MAHISDLLTFNHQFYTQIAAVVHFCRSPHVDFRQALLRFPHLYLPYEQQMSQHIEQQIWQRIEDWETIRGKDLVLLIDCWLQEVANKGSISWVIPRGTFVGADVGCISKAYSLFLQYHAGLWGLWYFSHWNSIPSFGNTWQWGLTNLLFSLQDSVIGRQTDVSYWPKLCFFDMCFIWLG